MRQIVASGRRVAGAVRSLFNARGLRLECVRVLHGSLIVPVLMNGSETMVWKEKERSSIRAVHIHNLRGLLGMRGMDKVPNARIRQLCGVTKGVDGKINEGVHGWFGDGE